MSLIVSSAVARVRIIVHCAGVTPLGQAGAMSGVAVAPSSTIVAPAEAGMRPQTATAPAVANKERFICRCNTTAGRQLREVGATKADLAPVTERQLGPEGPAEAQIFVTLTAFGPFGPASSSYETLTPSDSDR